LTIEPTPAHWLKDLPNLNHVHQAIFISANAVNYFFKALQHHQLSWPLSIETIAIGQKSAEELVRFGINIHHLPKVADSENLLALPSLQQIKNQTILLIKGKREEQKVPLNSPAEAPN
jgi:uroporphyrinogen-III synthase